MAPNSVANVARYVLSTPMYVLIVITQPDNGFEYFFTDRGLW